MWPLQLSVMLSFEGQKPAFGLPKYEKHSSGLGYQWPWKCRQASAESQVNLKQLVIILKSLFGWE